LELNHHIHFIEALLALGLDLFLGLSLQQMLKLPVLVIEELIVLIYNSKVPLEVLLEFVLRRSFDAMMVTVLDWNGNVMDLVSSE